MIHFPQETIALLLLLPFIDRLYTIWKNNRK